MSTVPTTQEEVKAELEDYLTAKSISNLFIHIVEELLLKKPDNPIQFIIEYLQNTYPEAVASDSAASAPESVVQSLTLESKEQRDLSSDDEDEDDEDDIGNVAAIAIAKRTRRRTAISAESTGKAAQMPVAIEKTAQQRKKMEEILNRNMLFQTLFPHQIQSIVDAFRPNEYSAGQYLYRQGADAGKFFILESGEAEVFVKSGEDDPVLVLTYRDGSGAAFGEQALMYNAPRNSSVKAKHECRVWELTREAYKAVLNITTPAKYEEYLELLGRVKILSTLTNQEKERVVDAMKEETFNAGQVIVRQGDRGKKLFIILKGQVVCTQQATPADPPREVLSLSDGGYFGEIALLTNRPRQATVQAMEQTTCITVERAAFKRVLGSLKEILTRDMEQYKQFVSEQI